MNGEDADIYRCIKVISLKLVSLPAGLWYNEKMTDPYRPSTMLFMVEKLKSKGKDSFDRFDAGVVKQNGRTTDECQDLTVVKWSGRQKFTVRPIWVGWSVCGVVVDDGWLIRKYGLLKDDLSDL
jgi:hypothetical protein